MKPRAYIETSIVSYLTARPSRDLVLAAHQQVTREWWAGREQYDLFVSQFVLDEAAAGDAEAAARRMATLGDAALLEVTDEAVALAEGLIAGGGLPPEARLDALHICRRHRSRDGLPADMELPPHRKRGTAWDDRGALPRGRLRATNNLHTPRAAEGGP